ncbi:hypothetical protein HYU90_00535 [Candidatus Collierbacteria bacterium]|nr:hypothetical protein [Candidatus Collierbacteria bacterium]
MRQAAPTVPPVHAVPPDELLLLDDELELLELPPTAATHAVLALLRVFPALQHQFCVVPLVHLYDPPVGCVALATTHDVVVHAGIVAVGLQHIHPLPESHPSVPIGVPGVSPQSILLVQKFGE